MTKNEVLKTFYFIFTLVDITAFKAVLLYDFHKIFEIFKEIEVDSTNGI